MGERVSGVDNDSYIDDCYLKINLDADSCSYYIPDSNSTAIYRPKLLNLKLYPNPVADIAMINIPYSESNHLSVRVISFEGKRLLCFQSSFGKESFGKNQKSISSGS